MRRSRAGNCDLRKTYTFYLRGGHEPDRFEPVLCRSDPEAMASARDLLARHGEREAVEVFFGEELLFRVARKAD